MEQYIYLDVYLGFNFLMDFFVLFITRIIIKNSKSVVRITLASVIGALYATVILVFGFTGVVAMIVTYLFVAELMSLVAFGKASTKNSIKRLSVIYCVTFASNGIVNAAYYGTRWGKNILEIANTSMFGNVSIGLILCVLIIVVTIIISVEDKVRKGIKVSGNIFQVKIYEAGIAICAKALYDTGNSLIEPITKKPVSVIELEAIKKLQSKKLKQIFIPYNSVGKPHGLMQGFIAEKMEVNGEIINNPIIGIHEGKLSQNRKYEMILHPDIIAENMNSNERIK